MPDASELGVSTLHCSGLVVCNPPQDIAVVQRLPGP